MQVHRVSVYTPELGERHPSATLSPPLEHLNTTPLTSSTTPAHLSPLSAADSRAPHLARPAPSLPQSRLPRNKTHFFLSPLPHHLPCLPQWTPFLFIPKYKTLSLVPPISTPFLLPLAQIVLHCQLPQAHTPIRTNLSLLSKLCPYTLQFKPFPLLSSNHFP